MAGGEFCEPPGTVVELENHLCGGSFLWGEDMGGSVRTTEGVGDVGGYREADIIEFTQVVPMTVCGHRRFGIGAFRKTVDEGTEHADATVAGGTAAESHDDVAATSTHGICHKLPRSVTGGSHRIPLLRREQGESAGLCYFYHGSVAGDKVTGRDKSHHRVAHGQRYRFTSCGCTESLQPPLAAITDGYLQHLCPGHLCKYSLCRRLIRLT